MMKENTDTVPAMLTPGEFVIRKDAAEQIGPEKLHILNNIDRLSKTAAIENMRSPVAMQEGGKVKDSGFFKLFKGKNSVYTDDKLIKYTTSLDDRQNFDKSSDEYRDRTALAKLYPAYDHFGYMRGSSALGTPIGIAKGFTANKAIDKMTGKESIARTILAPIIGAYLENRKLGKNETQIRRMMEGMYPYDPVDIRKDYETGDIYSATKKGWKKLSPETVSKLSENYFTEGQMDKLPKFQEGGQVKNKKYAQYFVNGVDTGYQVAGDRVAPYEKAIGDIIMQRIGKSEDKLTPAEREAVGVAFRNEFVKHMNEGFPLYESPSFQEGGKYYKLQKEYDKNPFMMESIINFDPARFQEGGSVGDSGFLSLFKDKVGGFIDKQKDNFERAAMMEEQTGTRNPFLKTAQEQRALQSLYGLVPGGEVIPPAPPVRPDVQEEDTYEDPFYPEDEEISPFDFNTGNFIDPKNMSETDKVYYRTLPDLLKSTQKYNRYLDSVRARREGEHIGDLTRARKAAMGQPEKEDIDMMPDMKFGYLQRPNMPSPEFMFDLDDKEFEPWDLSQLPPLRYPPEEGATKAEALISYLFGGRDNLVTTSSLLEDVFGPKIGGSKRDDRPYLGMSGGGYAKKYAYGGPVKKYEQGGPVMPPMARMEPMALEESPMPTGEQTYYESPEMQLGLDQFEHQAYMEHGPNAFRFLSQKYKPRNQWSAYDALVDAGLLDPYRVKRDEVNVVTDEQMDELSQSAKMAMR